MLNKVTFDTNQLIAQLTAVHHYSKSDILRENGDDCKICELLKFTKQKRTKCQSLNLLSDYEKSLSNRLKVKK